MRKGSPKPRPRETCVGGHTASAHWALDAECHAAGCACAYFRAGEATP